MSPLNQGRTRIPNSKFQLSLGSPNEEDDNNQPEMMEENSPASPEENTLHDTCQDNAVNKIYHENNKCNKSQNAMVI